MRRLLIAIVYLFLALPTFAQEQSPYEIALQRIEEARVNGAWELRLRSINLTELPPEIGNLVNLRELSLDDNDLTELPPEIGNLGNLRELYLYDNQLNSLPSELGNLYNLRELWLYNNQLSQLPHEFGKLTNLERLDLSNNRLSSLPPEIGKLQNLCWLNIANNQLPFVPTELSQLTRLTEEMPYCIDNYTLNGLHVEGNPLISPPPEVIAQGTPAILDYLRNEAWWHLQRLIIGATSSIGIVTAIVLGLRWRNRRGKKKRV